MQPTRSQPLPGHLPPVISWGLAFASGSEIDNQMWTGRFRRNGKSAKSGYVLLHHRGQLSPSHPEGTRIRGEIVCFDRQGLGR